MTSDCATPPRLATRIGFHLRRVAVQSQAELEEMLADLDLRTIHFAVLATIEAKPAGMQREIALDARIRPANLVPLLVQLRKRGLIHSIEDGADRRIQRFSLTHAGRAMLEEIDHRVRAHETRFFAALSPQEREGLLALLCRINQP